MLCSSPKCCHIISWFLVAFISLINGQQVELNGPSLSSGREYYCVNEELVFTCTGSGAGIQWEVPSLFTAQGFIEQNVPPLNASIAGVNATISLQQTMPFITTLRIRDVPNITVQCSTNVAGSLNSVSPSTSTTPSQVQEVILEIFKIDDNSLRRRINIRWTPVNGAFDLRHYRVELCINMTCTNVLNTLMPFADVIEDIAAGDIVYAQVSVESQCGDISNPTRSDSIIILILMEFYENLLAVIILGVFTGVFGLWSTITSVISIKYYYQVKKFSKSTDSQATELTVQTVVPDIDKK